MPLLRQIVGTLKMSSPDRGDLPDSNALLFGGIHARFRRRVARDFRRMGRDDGARHLKLARLPERPYCSLAAVLAAALGVSELFLSFADISIEARRRTVALSLWRPELDPGRSRRNWSRLSGGCRPISGCWA